jgi:hypothetical protein
MNETSRTGDRGPERPGAVGRTIRLGLGVMLIVDTARYFASGSSSFVLRAASIAVALFGIHVLMHRLLSRHRRAGAARCFTSVIALVPVVLAYALGLGEGPIFGSGAGQVGALVFLGVSLIVAGFRGDSGCEVMALPNALFGERCHLACIVFSPIDGLEKRLSARKGR